MHPIAYWTSFLRLTMPIIFFMTSVVIMGQQPKPTPNVSPPVGQDVQDVLRANTDVVNLDISVFDIEGRLVPGLKKSNFEIYDGKTKQEIVHFSDADLPIDLGIIFDVSGSMGTEKLKKARLALIEFLATCNYRDNIFLMGFNAQTQLLQDFATNQKDKINSVSDKLTFATSAGRTALYDAVYLGTQKIVNSPGENRKKALILISDGQDNTSRYTFSDVKNQLRETGVIIYTIAIPPAQERLGDTEVADGYAILQELSKLTGGKTYFPKFNLISDPPDSLNKKISVEDAMTQIAFELRFQYSIGYYPTFKDGNYHKVKVKITPPHGYPKLYYRTKEGYYAPKS